MNAFNAMGMKIPDEAIGNFMVEADLDGDGNLSFDEFEEMVKRMIVFVRKQEPEVDLMKVPREVPLFLGFIPIANIHFERTQFHLMPCVTFVQAC